MWHVLLLGPDHVPAAPHHRTSVAAIFSCHYRYARPYTLCTERVTGRRTDGLRAAGPFFLLFLLRKSKREYSTVTPFLELRNIGFHFGTKPILQQIAFTLDTGTCNALIGPNGVGKLLFCASSPALSPPPNSGWRCCIQGASTAACTHCKAKSSTYRSGIRNRSRCPFDFNRSTGRPSRAARPLSRIVACGLMREDRIAVDRALDLVDASVLRNRIFNETERWRTANALKIALGLAQKPDFTPAR